MVGYYFTTTRRDCCAISLRSSNPEGATASHRPAAARLFSNPRIPPTLQTQKKPPLARRFFLVGAEGFEPPTLCSQSRCASQAALRPDTKRRAKCIIISPSVNLHLSQIKVRYLPLTPQPRRLLCLHSARGVQPSKPPGGPVSGFCLF